MIGIDVMAITQSDQVSPIHGSTLQLPTHSVFFHSKFIITEVVPEINSCTD